MKTSLRFRSVSTMTLGLALAGSANAQPVVVQPPGDIPPITASTPGRLANLSVRALAGSGTQALALGFTVSGDGEKPIIIRAIGPTLATFGVPNPLPDPRLQLFKGGALLRTNNNWASSIGSNTSIAGAVSNAFASAGAFALAADSKDAAIIRSSEAGDYTAQVNAGTDRGIVLAELYDHAPASGARFTRTSVRAHVGTGAEIVIAGFVISGSSPVRVLLRALGPGLAATGVEGTIANPRMDLFRSSSVIASNDDWALAASPSADVATLIATASQVGASTLPDPISHDAALLVTLTPGIYTVLVSGVAGDTGIAHVELYEVP